MMSGVVRRWVVDSVEERVAASPEIAGGGGVWGMSVLSIDVELRPPAALTPALSRKQRGRG
jgi:hypothetical protein